MYRVLIMAGCLALALVSGPALGTAQVVPEMQTWRFDRDSGGRILRERDPSSRETRYTYTDRGQLEWLRFSDSSTVHYTYNATALRETMTDPIGTTRYAYDPLGHLQSVTLPTEPSLRYEIDLHSRVRRVELSDGWWASYAYDLFGRLTSVESPIGMVTFKYYPGQVLDGVPHPQVTRTLPNGVMTTWTYNADMQLVGLRHDRAGALLAGWTYAYDALERLIGIRDVTAPAELRYVFDDAGRLTTVFRGDHPVETYRYDGGSNQVVAQRSGATRQYHYDALGQLIVVDGRPLRYDPAGRLTYNESVESARHYRYDAAGRLAAVVLGNREVTYRYDGDGKLIERRDGSSVERWIYETQLGLPQVLAIYETNRPLAHHLLAPHHVAIRYASGQVVYLLEDHLGHVRALTDAGGGLIGRIEYSAFGSVDALPPMASGFGFTGAWHDAASGLVYLHARWYDPAVGRFISPDPWLGTLWNPVSLNRYVYAANDPVNLVDRAGMAPEQREHMTPIPPWFDVQGNVDRGRQLIEQRIIRNFQRMEQHPTDVLGRIGTYTANFGWQFLAEFWSFEADVWTQTQKAAESWGIHLADPERISLGEAWRETGEAAWTAGSTVLPALKSLDPTILAGHIFSKTGVLDWAINAGVTGALNRATVKAIKFGEAAYKTVDTGKTLYDLGKKAWDAWSPFIGSSTPTAPNARVGGVSLQAIAEGLKGLGAINGVSFDRAAGRLVLIGDSAPGISINVNLDDLAVALQSVARGVWPGVSIDPDPKNAHSDTMYFRYIGPTEHTHFGDTMGVSDRLMKVIGMGEDNENPGRIVRPAIESFKDLFQLVREIRSEGSTWSRFWLVPDQIQWEISSDGKTIWCTKTTMKVKTQVMVLEGNRLVDAPNQRDPASEAFAQWFSSHYDELAQQYPIYAELRELAKLVSLVSWLQEQLPANEFNALAEAFRPELFNTPKTTSAIRPTHQGVTLFGGVDLQPPPRTPVLPRGGRPEAVGRAVQETLPVRSSATVGKLHVANRDYPVVSLPFASLQPSGSLTLHATDLGTSAGLDRVRLTRHYTSALTQRGPFGRGWEIIVPELREPKSSSGVHWVLTDSWRTSERRVEASEFAEIKRHPDGVTLMGRDGSHWEFNRDGKLVWLRTGDFTLDYVYQDGRLTRTSMQHPNGSTHSLELIYKDDLVVSAVDSSGQTAYYRYDDAQRLIEVRVGEHLSRYVYDDQHHLSSMSIDGVSRSFTIEPDGAVSQFVDELGRRVEIERKTQADGSTLIRSSVPGIAEILLDASGRVVGLQGERWIVRLEHHDDNFSRTLLVDGTVVSRDQLDRQRNVFTREIIGDRTVEVTLNKDGQPQSALITAVSDGSQSEIHYDQYGRWVSMSDPTGGSYQREFGSLRELRYITTPSGTHHVRADQQGRPLIIRSPAGKELTFSYGVDNAPESVALEGPMGRLQWQRTSAQNWELRSAERVLQRLMLDENSRIVEAKAGELDVRAEHSRGGTIVHRSDGTQILLRLDAQGRLVEMQEHPFGTIPLRPPMPELTGKAEVHEKFEQMRERPKPR